MNSIGNSNPIKLAEYLTKNGSTQNRYSDNAQNLIISYTCNGKYLWVPKIIVFELYLLSILAHLSNQLSHHSKKNRISNYYFKISH